MEMNESREQQQEDLLVELVREPVNRFGYHAVTVGSTVYLLLITTFLVIILNRRGSGNGNWQPATVFLLLPLVALVLHLAKKKTGWIIGYFFYTTIFLVGTLSILQEWRGRYLPDWKGILLVLLFGVNTACLLLNSTRNYFRISSLTVVITSVLAIATGVLLFKLL